jgi:hypothetical protein
VGFCLGAINGSQKAALHQSRTESWTIVGFFNFTRLDPIWSSVMRSWYRLSRIAFIGWFLNDFSIHRGESGRFKKFVIDARGLGANS